MAALISRAAARITYTGEAEGFHVFRIETRRLKAFEAYRYKDEVVSFLSDYAYGAFHVGNGFADCRAYPSVAVENPDGRDLFVLLNTMVDVARFEESFPVIGPTPTLLL